MNLTLQPHVEIVDAKQGNTPSDSPYLDVVQPLSDFAFELFQLPPNAVSTTTVSAPPLSESILTDTYGPLSQTTISPYHPAEQLLEAPLHELAVFHDQERSKPQPQVETASAIERLTNLFISESDKPQSSILTPAQLSAALEISNEIPTTQVSRDDNFAPDRRNQTTAPSTALAA